jgi:putative phosphoserine phosphatase/1-acylglycerol-3-phosphate O-acyltransferase
MLRIFGVTLRVDNIAAMAAPGPKIVTFNHSSQLDGYVTLAMLPDNGTIVVKREFLYYPLIGQAILLLGISPIDRTSHERATTSLRKLAERVAQDRMTVLIAPEGTRSRTSEMRRFKLGAFHLALQSHAPIVPMVIIGARTLMPRGAVVPTPGTIHVRLLDPVDPAEFERDPSGFAERIRSLYVVELEGSRE